MRELFTAFILVISFQLLTHQPPEAEVRASSTETKQSKSKETSFLEPASEPKQAEVVKDTTPVQKPLETAPVQAQAIVYSTNCEDYRGIVARHFPADQIDNALLTMSKESGCRADAVSPTNDHGLMQINCTYHCQKVGGNVGALYDPETNIRLAGEIFSGRGWSAWYAVQGILW